MKLLHSPTTAVRIGLLPILLLMTTMIATVARADLAQTLAEQAKFQAEVESLTKQVAAQQARVKDLKSKSTTSTAAAVGKEGMKPVTGGTDLGQALDAGLDHGITKAAEEALKDLEKKLAKATKNLNSMPDKIARAKAKEQMERDKAAQAKAKKDADDAKAAETAKAKAKAKADAEAQAAQNAAKKNQTDDAARTAKKDSGGTPAKPAVDPALKNAIDDFKSDVQKHRDEKAKLDAYVDKYKKVLEKYRENPDPETRKILEKAKGKIVNEQKRLEEQKGNLIQRKSDLTDACNKHKASGGMYKVVAVDTSSSNASREVARDIARATSRDAATDVARTASKDAARDASAGAAKEASKDAAKEASKESSKTASKDSSKHSGKSAASSAAKSGMSHHY